MRDTAACRACLNTTEGKLEKIPDSWYRLFEYLTGVQVCKSDGYPNYFCVECKSHMNKAIAFRKKSRRAFFVLKEIMLVRKEVNLSDILTVNRSTTNLKSSLGIGKPENSRGFTLLETSEGSRVLMRNDLNVVNSCCVIDIEGENIEFPPEENPDSKMDSEPDVIELNKDSDIEQGDDNFDNLGDDGQELEESRNPGPDIDMEDIFKGLKEPNSEKSDDEVDDDLKFAHKRTASSKKNGIFKKFRIPTVAKALTNFNVQKLTDEQQKEAFQLRLQNPAFKKALYTCAICVEFWTEYSQLEEHYRIHMRRKDGKILCGICKDKCMDEGSLTKHVSENHMYKYTCRFCKDEVYALKDVLKHIKLHPNSVSKRDAKLMDKFHLIPVSNEDMISNFRRLTALGHYTCDACGTSFPRRKMLQRHVGKHSRMAKPFDKWKQCTVCGLSCRNANLLDIHMERNHNYVYHCKLCSYEAQTSLLAEHHLKQEHKSVEPITCQYCGAKSKSQGGLYYHMATKHWGEIYRHHCVECGLGFTSEYKLYAHQFKEHDVLCVAETPLEEGGLHLCKYCKVQFLSEKAYCNHLLQAGHEEAKDLPFKCLDCKKLFDSEEQCKDHVARCEMVHFPGPCRLCGEIVNSYKEFHKHCRVIHPNYTSMLNKRKLCDTCGKTYLSKCSCTLSKTDESRKRTKVLKDPKYKCSACEILFKRAEEVIQHVLNVHMKNPYSCSICSKTFKYRYSCKDHILKIHAPVKPYGCPLCDREFSHLDFLKKHAKKNHDVKVDLEGKNKKMRQFYLYPNMKVDLSLIDTRIVNEVNILVADYTDQIFETIQEYSDYIITNKEAKLPIEESNEDKIPIYDIVNES